MKKACLKVSLITIIINIVLFAIKLIAGILGNSSAMISDAIHSLSDVLSTFIVIVGLKISNKESDDRHQYGHERLENVASLILAFILFHIIIRGFLGGSVVKNLPDNAGDLSSIPGLGRSPREVVNGNPGQYSCLGNPMNSGAWWAIVHEVAKGSDAS